MKVSATQARALRLSTVEGELPARCICFFMCSNRKAETNFRKLIPLRVRLIGGRGESLFYVNTITGADDAAAGDDDGGDGDVVGAVVFLSFANHIPISKNSHYQFIIPMAIDCAAMSANCFRIVPCAVISV